MDIGKYLDLISTGTLWFTRVSELRKIDPYEAALTKYDEDKTTKIVEAKTKPELKQILLQHGEPRLANLIDKLTGKSLQFFQLVFLSRLPHIDLNAYTHSISCWHENPTESDAMWALYARREAGIAIKSTVARMLEGFAAAERIMSIAKVTYDSLGNLSAMSWGVFDSLLVKRHAFHHENEVRIIAMTMDGYESPEWTPDNQTYNVDPSKAVAPGLRIDCDMHALIEEVVLSPLMPLYSVQALESITAQVAPSIRIRRSTLLTKEEIPRQVSRELMLMIEEFRKTRLLRDLDEILPPGSSPPSSTTK
jgi:hypothetical protein